VPLVAHAGPLRAALWAPLVRAHRVATVAIRAVELARWGLGSSPEAVSSPAVGLAIRVAG